MLKAETFWLKQAQDEAFPKKDDEGLLRVDGRIFLVDDLSYNSKHPILLPKDHDVTRLTVTDNVPMKGLDMVLE